jgi:hypothetical protein
MEFTLEGPPATLGMLRDALERVPSVRTWALGCAVPGAERPQAPR